MRLTSLSAGFLLLGVGPAALAACNSDSLAAAGDSSDAGGPGASALDGGDAAPPPPVPDPCRGGVPLPPDQHFVAPGMCASLVGTDLGALRQITFAPNGDLFGVTLKGSIQRLRDADGDGFFQPSEISEYASTGSYGNNCDIDGAGGYLYAGGREGVKRWPYSPTSTSGGAGEDVVVGQPTGGHQHHTVHVYDGWLYVHSGSAGNATNPKSPAYDDERSLIRRFDLSTFTPGAPLQWLSGEVVTAGLRNANGFARSGKGRIFAVVNGLDDIGYEGKNVHDDNPGEQVVEIAAGKQYGYPFCFTAQRVVRANGEVVPAGTQLYNQGFGVHDDAWCATSSSKPATFIQAHSAPLDLTFFDAQPKGALPERYRGGAFVALHGSWDRQPATGYKVIWIPFDAAGDPAMPTSTATATTFPYEVVFGGGDTSGPKDGPWSWTADAFFDEARFAGVAVSPVDGALYAATDSRGYLYRLGVPK